MMRCLLLLFVLISFSVNAYALEPHVSFLPNGTELIHVRTKGAPLVSFRYLVRSGGASDPMHKTGLAHFLEHTIFHGSYATSESELFGSVRGAGGYLNAFTSPDYTVYVLDIPREHYKEEIGRYLRVITNPALTLADVEREQGVILTESLLFSKVGMTWVVDQFLFPGAGRGATLIGTARTRRQIKHSDLADFYSSQYIPSNTSIIIVGDITVEEARTLVVQNNRQPPEGPNDRVLRDREEPNIPINEKTRAPFNATMYGYRMLSVGRSDCRDLARLLELRLMIGAKVKKPLVSHLSTVCYRLRGNDLILAFAFSKSYEGGVLPDLLRRTFEEAKTIPPNHKEKSLIKEHYRAILRSYRTNTANLAQAIIEEAALPRRGPSPTIVEPALRLPKLDPKALKKAARSSFKKDQEILIHLSPFG